MHMNTGDPACEAKAPSGKVLDFTLLTNPLGPSNKAKNAMRAALKTISRHPDPATWRLRRHIARTEHIAPENILFGHGSTELLQLFLARLRPDKVLIPSPLPFHHAAILRGAGVEPIPFPLRSDNGFAFDIGRLPASISGLDMLLIPNPHGVTGSVIPLSALHALIERTEEVRAVLVLDEALIEFAHGDSPVQRAVRSDRVLIVRSFSLYHAMAGLRLGYAVGSASLLGLVSGPVHPGPVNTVAAAGAISSLRDKGFRARTAEFIKAEKVFLLQRLGRLDGAEIIDTPCPFVLIRPHISPAAMRRGLEEGHVRIEMFEDENRQTFLRVPIRRHRENARFAKVLSRIVRSQP